MDQTKSEYEFLDLSDINEEERSSLASALFPNVSWSDHTPAPSWETHYELSSCSSDPSTAGPPTASSSLDSLSERDMAPPPPPPAASPPRGSPQHYGQHPPPPLYGPSPPWAPTMQPPNVYVSQVTANVNLHGYMGQGYYQSHQAPYAEQRGREGRRGRRGGPAKRAPSPPQPYLYYPQYYPQGAQGAPLYHMPVYPPVSYVPSFHYPYVGYPLVDEGPEKGPEEYPDMMLEHEHHAHEMYYHAHPPPVYEQARHPDEQYPVYFSLPPPAAPPTHQFNVHAKNFVRQSDHKNYNTQPQEQKPSEPPVQTMKPNPPASDPAPQMKELKINSNKPPAASPKHNQEKNLVNNAQTPPVKNPVILTNDKVAPKPPVETPKTAWSATNTKPVETPVSKALPHAVSQPSPTTVTPVVPAAAAPKPAIPAVVPNKVNKALVPAPFTTHMKTIVKATTAPPAGVIVSQQTLPAKAPFATKPKRDTSAKTQDAHATADTPLGAPVSPAATSPPQAIPEVKPAPLPSVVKVNQPVVITPNTFVSKAPFSHARKPSTVSEAPVTPPAPPPAPTASDFPPPPAPRRAAPEQAPPAVPSTPAPSAPSPVKTWASLFGNGAPASTPAPLVQPLEEKPAPVSAPATVSTPVNPPSALPTSATTNQKPVAKVGPFDASPLQWEAEKATPTAPTISYSEKTSNGQTQKGSPPSKEEFAARDNQQTPVPPHINDPNSYRMGEFLAKYQLNHHPVSLQPRGLSNRSNYCYINAILQALIACPPFYNMLKTLPHQQKKGKSPTPIIDAMVELINEFSVLPPGARPTRAERSGDGPPPAPAAGPALEPASVLRALRGGSAGGDSFRVDGRQEDAEEFLGCLLNGLNDEMLELIKLVEPEEPKDVPVIPNGNDVSQDSDDDDEWKVIGPKNKGSVERRCLAGRTPLSDIFRGQLRSRLHRLPAPDSPQPETTHCVQPFFTLPLDIEKSTSVRDALEKVAGRERMEGVRCRERGRPVDAWTQSLLERLPAALLLHLKCFHCRPQDNSTAKILKTIDYPIDLKIDPKIITSKMKYSPKQRSYKLFAVVYHEGAELEKGHYLADAYHAGSGGWLRYDDSIVTAVTEQQVLHPRLPRTPYLLLYRRQDTMQPPAARHPPPN